MSPLLSDVLSQKQGSGDISLFVICQGSLRNTRPRLSLTVFPGRGAYLKNSVGPYLYRGPGKGFGIISLFKNTGKRSELDRGFFHAASYPIHLIIVSRSVRLRRYILLWLHYYAYRCAYLTTSGSAVRWEGTGLGLIIDVDVRT